MVESGAGEGGSAKEMGEDFLRRQREIVARHVKGADVVLTTALVPGRPAPRLVSREMVESMRPGAVIVDLAVEEGGNCELSASGREIEHHGVRIHGPANLAAEMPQDASTLYARNVLALLSLSLAEETLRLDLDDEIIAGALVVHQGEVRHAATAARLAEGGTSS
jgi:NAD(P) transhydrogenase subunit alpha